MQGVCKIPNFGNEGAKTNTWNIENSIRGGKFVMGAINGEADSITVIIRCSVDIKKMKCAIYNSDATLLGQTEEKNIPATGDQQITFNFSAPKPTLTALATYALVAWSEALNGVGELGIAASAGDEIRRDAEIYNGFPDPWADGADLANFIACIYCTYTEVSGIDNTKRHRYQHFKGGFN